MKGRRTNPRVECERGRMVKTSTEQREKQKGAFNMKIIVEWKASMTEMRKNTAKQRKEEFGKELQSTNTLLRSIYYNY